MLFVINFHHCLSHTHLMHKYTHQHAHGYVYGIGVFTIEAGICEKQNSGLCFLFLLLHCQVMHHIAFNILRQSPKLCESLRTQSTVEVVAWSYLLFFLIGLGVPLTTVCALTVNLLRNADISLDCSDDRHLSRSSSFLKSSSIAYYIDMVEFCIC